MPSRRVLLPLLLLTGLAASPARGSDLFGDDPQTLLRTETVSVEALAGYVAGSSTEYVYGSGRKLSQLNWDINGALALGGRAAFRPVDWLTIRARGWATIDADGKMRDYDWLAGYNGFNSWTHLSVHPKTVLPQAWSGDLSASVAYWQDSELALSVVGGYRHYEAKFDARGGNYIYSSFALRDTFGTLPAGQTAVTYRQVWDAPYAGLGVAYASGAWGLSGEIFGGPVVRATADDDHPLRPLNIKSKFGTSAMVGVNGAVEYRLTDRLSLVGRFEYQHFSEARGSARYTDPSTGQVFFNPKPGSGAEAETALLSLGVKARL